MTTGAVETMISSKADVAVGNKSRHPGKTMDPVHQFFASRLFSFMKDYKNIAPANLLALSNGKWKVPVDKIDAFLDIYIAEYETVPFGLVFLKSPVYPYPMDLDHLEDAGSVGPPLIIVRTVLDTLAEVLGEKAKLIQHVHFEQRLEQRFHAFFPRIIVDEKTAIRLYNAHVKALNRKFPAVTWGDIVDKCVVTNNGIRLLGSYKYPELRDDDGKIVKGATKNGKSYSVRRLDREGGYYRPCKIDFVEMAIESLPITKEAILERSLFKPDLTVKDIVELPSLDTTDVEAHMAGMFVTTDPVHESAAKVAQPIRNPDDSDEVIKLLSILNPSRFANRNEWRDIATILKSIGGDKYKQSWLKYSRTSDKFELGVAEDLWDQVARADYEGQPLTIRSLHFRARQDSPHAYSQISITSVQGNVKKCFDSRGASVRMAELFVAVHGDDFRCVNIKKQTLFHFRGHRWHKAEIDIVNLLLSSSIYGILMQQIMEISDGLSNLSEVDRKRGEEELKNAHKTAAKLLDTNFKRSLWGEICHMLKDNTFYENLDTIPHLVGFENGVYDLNHERFREGCPEDLISMSTGYDFALEDDEAVGYEIKDKLISAIFEDDDTCIYAMKIYAACLYGSRKFEEFYLLTGKGGNGKGVFNEMVLQTFGEYAKTMTSTFFTEKSSNSGSCTPQLADKKGIRVLISTEPEENEKLQVGRLKQISGNDQIQARDLFQSLFYYTPQFGIFIQCNTIPGLSKVDGGVQRRLRVVEYPFDFVENPTMPHQREANNELKETLVKSLSWKQQFMRMLIFIYVTQVKGRQSLTPPESVVQASKSFLDSCNPVAEWLIENCKLTGNRKNKATFPEVLLYYKDVHKRQALYCNVKRNHFYDSLRLCGLPLSKGGNYDICHGIVLEPPERCALSDVFVEDDG